MTVFWLPVPARRHGAVERGDDAGGDGAGQAERRTDRDDLLADLDVLGRAQLDRGQAGLAVDLDDRDVRGGVGTDEGGRGRAAVRERDQQLAVGSAAGDDVVVVMISPSDERITPEPSPSPRVPATWICTTLGTTLAATASTDPAGALDAGLVLGFGASSAFETGALLPLFDEASDPTTPPMPPLTSASATAPATRAVRPTRRGSVDGVGAPVVGRVPVAPTVGICSVGRYPAWYPGCCG